MSSIQVSELLVLLLCIVCLVHVFTVWLRNRKKVHRKDDSIEVGGSGPSGEPGSERHRRATSDHGPDSGDAGGGGDGGGGGGGD